MNGVQLITQAEYARRRGVAKSAVAKAVSERRITLIDGKVDPFVADIQWERNTRARADGGRSSTAAAASGSSGNGSVLVSGGSGTSDHSAASVVGEQLRPMLEVGYSEARARRERADAEKAEILTAKLHGAMVLREAVDRGTFDVLREARDRLTSAGRRIASEVANLTTAEACESVIDREHRIVLELMVSSFREKLGTAPKDNA